MMNSPKPFATTGLGSFPSAEPEPLVHDLLQRLDIPFWPQLIRRNFRENMYVQYSARLPGLVLDEAQERIYFDTSRDLAPSLEAFYERYLADDLEAFALPPDYAAGFYCLMEALPQYPGEWIKGQVTGPVSFGLTVTDQSLRASLYNEQLADPIVKNMTLIARWQTRRLRQARPNVILFVDEPYMASFGSAYISLGREQVISMLDEVFEGIHAEGGWGGVHCCANTDWSVLLATQVDILNLDAYGYLENLALYPAELGAFLERGGWIAWGIVPNNPEALRCTPEGLAGRLRQGFELIASKAQARGINLEAGKLAERSLVAPACGLGPTTPEVAARCMELLVETGKILRALSP